MIALDLCLKSLSSLVDNLSDGFHCNKCIDCKPSFDYMITRDDIWIYDIQYLGVLSLKQIIRKTLINLLITKLIDLQTHEFGNKDINGFL